MAERKLDRYLGIKTIGIREWEEATNHYNRYEATPYAALNQLFRKYKFKKDDQIVDFGSGRGRVPFYIHHHFDLPVTGIENNDKTFEEALYNKAIYKQKNDISNVPIHFEFGLAEHYRIKPQDNCFYFFNPFSLNIFKQVVSNILVSFYEVKRPVDIILYYPLPEFKKYLKKKTPFKLINKIKAPVDHGKYGKFLIFRLKPSGGITKTEI